MTSARRRALAAAGLAWCAAAAPAPAQEDAAEVLEILRSLAPRAGQTEAPRYVAEGVQFDYASDRLTAQAQGTLDRLARALRSAELGGLRFRVEGHTDSRGSAAYNLDLSVRRARAVAAYLAEVRGFAAARFDMVGHGESRPRDPTNPEGAINRRVEIVTLIPPPAPPPPPPAANREENREEEEEQFPIAPGVDDPLLRPPAADRRKEMPVGLEPPTATPAAGDRPEESFVHDVLTGGGN